MHKTLNNDQIKTIIERLIDKAMEAKHFQDENGKTDFTEGLISAYHAMLDAIKNQLIIDNVDLKEFGLDIDLEKELS